MARRRVGVFALITWLPLLLLSLIGGHALGGGIKIPFLYDIETHVRFLIALPILIAAERIVHSRIRPVVNRFVERKIIVIEDLPRFRAAIDSARRIRNSPLVETGLLILVYTLGVWVWKSRIATGMESWYATSDGSQSHLTPAGDWYVFVSVPISHFVLLRWYMRFFIWFQFLWRVSRLNLRIFATHPDRAGGLGFLGNSSYTFGLILFAQGSLLAAVIATRVLYEGKDLMSFRIEAGGLIVFLMLLILCPLLVFTPNLKRAKRRGLRDYGLLSNRYVEEFDKKWIEGSDSSEERLLGTGDIQSLADIANSYAIVQQMRPVPFGLKDGARLVAVTAAPLLPLALTVFSVEELFNRLIKIFL